MHEPKRIGLFSAATQRRPGLSRKQLTNILSAVTILFFRPALGSVFDPLSLWRKKDIRVCFAETYEDESFLGYRPDGSRQNVPSQALGSWSPTLRKEVISIVTKNFSPSKTGISFSGFNMCHFNGPKAGHSDAVIYISNPDLHKIPLEWKQNGFSTIGRNAHFPLKISKMSFVWLLNPTASKTQFDEKKYQGRFEDFWTANVLHEFGHLAGLAHEHSRRDFVNDPLCLQNFSRIERQSLEYEARGAGSPASFEDFIAGKNIPGYAIFGDYDSESMMSYCKLADFAKNKSSLPRLSRGDLDTLKSLYVTGP